ncbi:MAG: helix-turn-helix transcriptional regulator, partial [Victivallales bacterium]|nr:helix-turn-helix transcriptional regulator [Victivallales bacterium]
IPGYRELTTPSPMPMHLDEDDFSMVYRLIEDIIALQEGNAVGRRLRIHMDLLNIILLISLHAKRGDVHKRLRGPHDAICRLLPKLEQECAHPWTIEEMAAFAGMSVSSFSHHFRNFVKISPYEYLLRLRMDLAITMLGAGAYNVETIATRCGFANPCHFTRLFHARYGCAPRVFQRHTDAGVDKKRIGRLLGSFKHPSPLSQDSSSNRQEE